MTVYVQKDESGAVICVFANPQPGNAAVIAVADNDAAYVTFVAKQQAIATAQALANQATGLLAAGLSVTSTGTSSLNGVYGCDPQSQHNIMAVSIYILVNNKFPGDASTYTWLDLTGTPHTFPATTSFQNVATAIAD